MGVDRDRILTLRDMHDVPDRPPMTVTDLARVMQSKRPGAFRIPDLTEVAGPPVAATIETFAYMRPGNWRTRWGGHCWLDYEGYLCPGYEDVDPDDPRFMCYSCYNEATGGFWRPVTFPDRTERPLIEAALLERTDRASRAYIPAEAVAVLKDADPLLAAALGTDGDTLTEIVRQNIALGVRRR